MIGGGGHSSGASADVGWREQSEGSDRQGGAGRGGARWAKAPTVGQIRCLLLHADEQVELGVDRLDSDADQLKGAFDAPEAVLDAGEMALDAR